MELDKALHDRQTEAEAFLGVFLRERATAERGHDNSDLVFRNSGTTVAHSHILAAARGPADPDLDRSALRSELDRVRQKVQYYLANSAFVGPNPRQIRLDGLFDGDLPFFLAQHWKMPAII